MKCLVCGRGGEADMCRHHAEAKKKLLAAFPLWARAHEDMSWEKYLDNVKRNVQTGQWAKETAEFLHGG
jgi:hypothetical protein